MNTNQLLHEKAVMLSKNYQKAESALLDVLIEVEKKNVFRVQGYASMLQYCVKALGLSEDRALGLIGVARTCAKIPEVKLAIDRGEMSVSNGRKIGSVISQENKQEWIEKASLLSQRDLEREIVKVKPESVIREKIKAVTETKSEFRSPISRGLEAKLRRVQDLLAQKKQRHCGLEEMLGVMADEFLKRHDPVEKAVRVVAKQKARPAPIASESLGVRRVEDGKRVKIPQPVLYEVNLRDRGQCQFKLPNGEKCGQARWIHFHHVRPVELGGSNSVENLISLCSNHHQVAHRH